MANANFTPDIGPYTTLKPFRFWCQKVLPLVYDDSLSYYELLGKVVDYLNKTMEDVDTQITDIQGLLSAYEALQGWVNAYYTSADFAAAIDDGLDRMAESGQLTALINAIIAPQLPDIVDLLLPETVMTLLPDEVSSQIGGTVATQLPGVVSNQIPGTVATQLPAVVSNQIPGTVATQLPAVVSNQIGPVVEDKIVDPVEDWLDANVSGGIAVDRTLSVLGAGADAAFTGARLETLDNTLGYEHVADTGFIITTANPFAFNVEIINDLADFSDLGTHTYKMLVIPVNTGDKYCINAHKISIANISADHFAVTYAFCAKWVGNPDTDTPYYLPTTYSANDADNVIATVPEIVIPTGQSYDQTTGYLVVITANIEDPVYKVVDEGIRKDINDLKSDLALQSIQANNAYADTEYAKNETDWIRAGVINAANPQTTSIESSTTRLITENIYHIAKGAVVNISIPDGYKHRILFAKNYTGKMFVGQRDITFDQNIGDASGWNTSSTRTVIAPDCQGFCVSLAKSDDSAITLNDLPEDLTITVESILTMGNGQFVNPSDINRNFGYYQYSNIPLTFKQGNWTPAADTISPSQTRCYAEKIILTGSSIKLDIPNTMKGRINFFMANGTSIDTTSTRSWTTGSFEYTIPEGAAYAGISVAFTDDANIIPSDCGSVSTFCFLGTLPVDEFKGKKISIIGDSISTFAGADAEVSADGHSIANGTYTYAGNHCRYPNSYLSNVNDTYWMKLINSLGLVLGVNDSWAGSRVSWNRTEGSDYGANIYIASPTRIGHLDDNGTPDIILVNAGTNDIGTSVTPGTFNTENPVSYTNEQISALPVATFADAYRALLIRLQKAYPLARIVVMLPNYTTSYYNPERADIYLEIIKEACDYFGVPWVDMRTVGITMYNTGTYTGDGIHPNVSGMNLLYEKMVKYFKFSL